MAIEQELWLNLLLEHFYPDNSFMLRSRDLSEFVEYNKLHLAEAGVDPNVLVDNTVYPVPVVERTDNPLEILLRTLDSENTVVRSVDELQTAYLKIESIIRQHRQSLYKKAGQLAAFNWTPAQDAALTPVKKTSGAVNGNSLKALTFEDVEDIDTWYNENDAPLDGRIFVLSPKHSADLKAADRKLYKEIMKDRKLFGFDLYMYSQTPFFDVTTGIKQPFGSAATANSVPSSFSYLESEVGRAIGDQEIFAKYKDPEQRGDVLGFQMRFTAVPLRNKYLSAIFSDK